MALTRASEDTLEALTALGVTTVGELAALPRDGVARRFGQPLLDVDQRVGMGDVARSWRWWCSVLAPHRPHEVVQRRLPIRSVAQRQVETERNRTAVLPVVPIRGMITDRNGVVLATNYSAFTLEITPSKVVAPLDEVVDQLGEVIEIQGRDKRRFKKLREESKSFESVPIRTRLSDEEVARFAAQRYRFPGVEIRARLFRNYPYNELASHVIGYIGRINPAEKAKSWADLCLALQHAPQP